ncbi:putative reverse transcriptase domain-containing protein [Tanacetum coccineum]
MDESMVDSESDKDETDDEDDDGDVVDEPKPSTYDVGCPSTAIAPQPQVIDDLYTQVDNLRDRQGVLTRKMEEVSDAEATNSVAIKGIHPRLTASDREGALMQYLMWMEERLTVLEKSLPGPPPRAYTYTFLFLCRDRIMPPKQMSQAAIAMLIANEVKKALDADRDTRNTSSAGGSGNVGEGAIELCRWFEKIKCTFKISECAERNKVKFAAATLQGRALTWWNTQVATLGLAEANGKSWYDIKKIMLEEFCPEEEISRMKDELRNLRLRDHDIAAYTNRFKELVLLCPDVVPSTKKKISQYIKGLPSYIQCETYSSKPTTLNEAIRMAHGLMKHKVQGWKEKNADQNKRK